MLDWSFLGIMENNMETTIMGLGPRVEGLGFLDPP